MMRKRMSFWLIGMALVMGFVLSGCGAGNSKRNLSSGKKMKMVKVLAILFMGICLSSCATVGLISDLINGNKSNVIDHAPSLPDSEKTTIEFSVFFPVSSPNNRASIKSFDGQSVSWGYKRGGEVTIKIPSGEHSLHFSLSGLYSSKQTITNLERSITYNFLPGCVYKVVVGLYNDQGRTVRDQFYRRSLVITVRNDRSIEDEATLGALIERGNHAESPPQFVFPIQ